MIDNFKQTFEVNIMISTTYYIMTAGIQVLPQAGHYGILVGVNTLRPKQYGRHFADNTFKRIFLNENVGIWIKISLKFVHKGSCNNILALV